MTTDPKTLATLAALTMSSVEIAERTGKEHGHVMRDIRVMLEALGLPLSKFGSSYRAGNGKMEPCFHLPKRETLILVSGYSIPLRAAVVRRWQELEAERARPSPRRSKPSGWPLTPLRRWPLKGGVPSALPIQPQASPKRLTRRPTMNMHTTLPALTVSEIEGEPRVLDTDLGKALGMAQPRDIRRTIQEHMEALKAFGGLRAVSANPGPKGGRPSTAYYLNEEQALYVTMHCRTERAEAVKVQLVKVFTAWRRGQLVQAESQAIDFTNPLAMAPGTPH